MRRCFFKYLIITALKRKDFLYLTGMGVGAAMLPNIPVFGKSINPEVALQPVDVALKKRMADVALNAARSRGASYADENYFKGT